MSDLDYSRFTGDGSEPWLWDKYYYALPDDLPDPEDVAAENEYELVGLYMRVYTRYCQVSKAITDHITGNPDVDQYLSALVTRNEEPLEKWLNRAVDFMPEWWNPELLTYPDAGKQG